MKIALVIGTRPEIIKMAPVIRCLDKFSSDLILIHTGQHYTTELNDVFFEELQLPEPQYNINSGSGTHAETTAKIMIGTEKILAEEQPDIVLVEGDTNSVLAASLAAAKIGISVGHIEAGLRSHDRTMPEELNRIITDHISTLLFAPTEHARRNLVGEGIEETKIFVTGNTIVEAVHTNIRLAENSSNILESLGVDEKPFILVTVHRQENTDVPDRLNGILSGLNLIYSKYKLPIIYPIHPRTKLRMQNAQIPNASNITFIEPVKYFDFLILMKHAVIILTDSGGVQEESCILRVPCITLRDNTERPETLEVESNILAGTNPEMILRSANKMVASNRSWPNPFGDGKAAMRIVETIIENNSRGKL